MTSFSRADRVSGLIQETLSDLIKKSIHDPRMSPDLRLARIYFVVSGDEKISGDAAKGFESARGFIKRNLAAKLGLRYMPDLKFFYDDSFDYGSHIDQLLEKIKTSNGPDQQSN